MDEATETKLLRAALAAEQARTAELEARVLELEEQLAKALELLGRNSGNSNQPPSSDPPSKKKSRKKRLKNRPRGGQKGHKGLPLLRIAR